MQRTVLVASVVALLCGIVCMGWAGGPEERGWSCRAGWSGKGEKGGKSIRK